MAEYTLDITPEMVTASRQMALEVLSAQTYAEFKTRLLKLNGTVRGYKADEFQEFRDHPEQISMHYYPFQMPRATRVLWVAPPVASIDSLMEDAWKKSKSLATNSLRGGYLYHAVCYVHPFKNGNGRSGRALFYADIEDDEIFKQKLWPKTETAQYAIYNEIGDSRNFLHEEIKLRFAELTGISNAQELRLTDCSFEGYWRSLSWAEGISKEFAMCLEERQLEYTFQFPQVVLAGVALELDIISPEALSLQNGKVFVNIHPDEVIKKHGDIVFARLQDEKTALVRNTLADKSGLMLRTMQSLIPATIGLHAARGPEVPR